MKVQNGAEVLSVQMENLWLRHWASSYSQEATHGPLYYIYIYSAVSFRFARIFALLSGLTDVCLPGHHHRRLHRRSSLLRPLCRIARCFQPHPQQFVSDPFPRRNGSDPLCFCVGMLEAVLFATIRFHDTISTGRLLNRFGKDLEGVDSSLADNLGRTIIYGLNICVTFVSIASVGGWTFAVAAVVLGSIYWKTASIYGQISRDARRLDSITRSPLYGIYSSTIAGVTVVRAFGACEYFSVAGLGDRAMLKARAPSSYQFAQGDDAVR